MRVIYECGLVAGSGGQRRRAAGHLRPRVGPRWLQGVEQGLRAAQRTLSLLLLQGAYSPTSTQTHAHSHEYALSPTASVLQIQAVAKYLRSKDNKDRVSDLETFSDNRTLLNNKIF